MGKSYSPFSVETTIPWLIIFNVSLWIILWIVDAVFGEDFDNVWRGSLSIVFFILNMAYFLYIIVINMALVYKDVAKYIGGGGSDKKKNLVNLDLWDVTTIFFANALVWSWLFVALFSFKSDYYFTNIDAPPRFLFYLAIRMWAFAAISVNGVGCGITIPASVVPEVFSTLSVLFKIFLNLILFSAILNILWIKNDTPYEEEGKKKKKRGNRGNRVWNPFSVESDIPWLIIFNVAQWIVLWIIDAAAGDAFPDTARAILCLILFIINISYYFYTIIIHMALIYPELKIRLSVPKEVALDLWDLVNIFIGNALIWTYISLAIYYFNNTYYATNMMNEPRYLFLHSLRFWFFNVWTTNGIGYGATIPTHIVSELFVAFNVLTTQFFYITLFGPAIGLMLINYVNYLK